MDKCPSGLRSTPRKRVRANPSASSNLALSACNEGWNNGVSAFFCLSALHLPKYGIRHRENVGESVSLLVHGSVDPLVLLDVAAGEDADVEHAVAVIAAMGDGDVVVVDHTVVCGVQTDPTSIMVDFDPCVRGALAAEQSRDVSGSESDVPAHGQHDVRVILAYALSLIHI